MTARGQMNVGKRLDYARAPLRKLRVDEWMGDPDAEQQFGYILQAVAEARADESSEERHHQPAIEADPLWQPDWRYIARRLPRRFGPYLPWLSKQVAWWFSPEFGTLSGKWQQLIVLLNDPDASVFKKQHALDQWGLDVIFAHHGAYMVRGTPWGNLFEGLAEGANWMAAAFPSIVDWAVSQRPNLSDYNIVQAYQASATWHERLANQGKHRIEWFDRGEVVYEWDDGWTLQSLRGDQLDEEGNAMGNCIAGYEEDVDAGSTTIYSLRDPLNQPHADIEWGSEAIDDFDDLDSGTQSLVVNEATAFKREAFEAGTLDEDELDEEVDWQIDKTGGVCYAVASIHGQMIGSIPVSGLDGVREVRGRGNDRPSKKHTRRVLEGMFAVKSELLDQEQSWSSELFLAAAQLPREEIAGLARRGRLRSPGSTSNDGALADWILDEIDDYRGDD